MCSSLPSSFFSSFLLCHALLDGWNGLECWWQALFFTYGGMEPKTASVMAEMLGFNPDLVMPQLQQQLDVVLQAESS